MYRAKTVTVRGHDPDKQVPISAEIYWSAGCRVYEAYNIRSAFSHGDEIDYDFDDVNIVKKTIKSINGSEKIESVILSDGSTIEIDGLFIALGVSSGIDFARHIGIDINDSNNSIKVNENYMTNIEGIFAIGDCIGGVYQIAKAVSDGCVASKSIIEYLKKRKEA